MFRYAALLCLIIILLILATGFNSVADPITIQAPGENIFIETSSEIAETVEFFTESIETKFETFSSITQNVHQLRLQEGESAFHPLNKMFITLHTIRR